jgi:VWFA-related protein
MTRASIAAALVALAMPLTAAQGPTFSTKLEVVRLDVLVTANGKPLRGLTLDDFEVLDNGVRQTLDLASFEQIPLGVVLALDASASLSAPQLDDLRSAGRAVLTALKHDDQAALVTFSEIVSLEQALTGDAAAVESALGRVDPEGGTALVDGVYSAVTVADASRGRGLAIVFSDGIDTASWLTKDQVIDAARRSDVVVYGVATGRTETDFLSDITDETGGRLLQIESTADIRDRFLTILAEFRERYVLSYTPRGVARSGWHRLDVRIKGRRATVRARPGYTAQ